MEAAFLAVLDGLAKPLTEGPAFQDKTFVFRFAQEGGKTISLTNRITGGRILFETGEPQRFDAAVTWHGNMARLFNKVVPNLLSPSPLAALRLIALNLRGEFEIEGSKKLGMAFIKQARKALKGMDPQTKMYCTTPLFHMAGYASGPITWVASGNQALVFATSPSFDPRETCELLQREKFQIAVMVPTMWKRLVEFPDFDKYDTSSLVLGLSGAAVLPADMKKKILLKFKDLLLVDAFGQTEMAPVTAVQVDGVAEAVVDRKVGRPLAGVEVRIVDESGKAVGPRKVGEIHYKSETIMKEYFKDPEKTQEAIVDGWFKSGDLGWMDEEGNLYVVERVKETINSGGEKIYPFEVEEAIKSHPAVVEVAVIGVPDPEWGQAIRAVVQVRPGHSPTEREIIDWCKGKVADFKKPKSVVFVKEMPTSPVEKVLRGKIREMYGKA
jgi:acyl-CoA synthetase (AMP-forming)/AMP-acid ligase II